MHRRIPKCAVGRTPWSAVDPLVGLFRLWNILRTTSNSMRFSTHAQSDPLVGLFRLWNILRTTSNSMRFSTHAQADQGVGRGPGGPPYRSAPRSGSARLGLATALILAISLFLYCLIQLQLLTSAAGQTYPTYSSLRADPLGVKALFDSLSESGDYRVTRSYKLAESLQGTGATVLRLWYAAGQWEFTTAKKHEPWETLAAGGARAVVGIHGLASSNKARQEAPDIEARLGVHLDTPARKKGEATVEKETGFTLELIDPVWRCLLSTEDGCLAAERPLGKGALVLLTKPYLLSNEGLSKERDAVLITKILGEQAKEIIFDEADLGLEESGSLMGLVRRYRLAPAVGVLLGLAALFIWRGSTSLAPAHESARNMIEGRGSVTGLTNLLCRTIPEKQLIAVCIEEWKRAKTVLAGYQTSRLGRVEQAAARGGGPLETYQAITKILREKS